MKRVEFQARISGHVKTVVAIDADEDSAWTKILQRYWKCNPPPERRSLRVVETYEQSGALPDRGMGYLDGVRALKEKLIAAGELDIDL